MKNPFLLLTALLATFATSEAASVFWSFQTTASGNTYTGPATATPSGGAFTTNSGFTGTPTLTAIQGSGSATIGQGGAGGATYTDPSTTIIWEGGGTVAPGNSLQWGSNATQNLTGSGFIIGLNTTGLSDLQIRMDVRSAQASGAVGAPTGFSAINYRTDGGAWVSIGVAPADSPTWLVQQAWQTDKAINLSSFDFLENQATLELQFIFNAGAKDTSSVHNMRIDNLLVTAVPEPASFSLAGLGLAGLLLRRARQLREE